MTDIQTQLDAIADQSIEEVTEHNKHCALAHNYLAFNPVDVTMITEDDIFDLLVDFSKKLSNHQKESNNV